MKKPMYDRMSQGGRSAGAAASLPQQISQELLVCRVCYGQFTSQTRLPKVLACSHTFCEPCIIEYLKTRPKKSKLKFPCPLCRKITLVTPDGVSGLPHNYTILELISLLEKENKGMSPAHQNQTLRRVPSVPVRTERTRWTGPSSQPHDESGGGGDGDDDVVAASRSVCSRCRCPGAAPNLCDEHLFCQICYVGISHATPEDQPLRCPLCLPLLPNIQHRTRSANWTLPRRIRRIELKDKRPPPFNPSFAASKKQSDSSSDLKNPSATDVQFSVGDEEVFPPTAKPKAPPRRATSFRSPPRADTLLSRRVKTRSMSFATAPPDRVPSDESVSSISPIHVTPPKPPVRRSSATSVNSPIICARKFGRYSDERMQTKCFKQPSRAAISETGDIVVIDSLCMTVQVFTGTGEYRSMFKVTGVQGCCFMNAERLVIATHRGVELYKLNGEQMKEVSAGSIISVVPYNFGFVACQQKRVLVYRQTLTVTREIKKVKTSRSPLKRSTSFKNISDVSVTSLRDIVVMDTGLGAIFVMDGNGMARTVIDPAQDICGALLKPHSVTVDAWNNIFVADTEHHRVLRFSANGHYSRCVLDFSIGRNPNKISPCGLAVTKDNQLLVLVHAAQYAEVRFYQLG